MSHLNANFGEFGTQAAESAMTGVPGGELPGSKSLGENVNFNSNPASRWGVGGSLSDPGSPNDIMNSANAAADKFEPNLNPSPASSPGLMLDSQAWDQLPIDKMGL